MSITTLLAAAVLAASPPETRVFVAPSTDGHLFGKPLSVSGNTFVGGAVYDDTYGTNSGSVSVFADSSGWSLEQTVYGLSPATGDQFGQSVCIHGDWMAVGTPKWDGFSNERTDVGCVFFFTRSGGTWTTSMDMTVDCPDFTVGRMFGMALDMDSNWLAVGAGGGGLYIYSWDSVNSEWDFFIDRPCASMDCLSLVGDTILVGQSRHDDLYTDDGAVSVYEYTDTWRYKSTKTIYSPEPADNHRFGMSLDLDGDTVVVGSNSDAAYVYEYDGSDWVYKQKLTASDGAAGDRFGWAVAIEGNTIVVGSRDHTVTDGGQGAAYVFLKIDGTWVEKHKLIETSASAGDHYGDAVAFSQKKAYVGVPYDNQAGTDAGVVCIYEIPPELVSLGFTTQPTDIVITDTITPQVTAYDQYGQVYTTPVTVDIDLYDNPSSATLVGTTSVVTSGGVASFDLGLSDEGVGYTLVAMSGALPSPISDSFDVTLPAAKFVILNPTDGTVDSPITVTVQAQDATNAIVTSYQDDVTLVASGSATGDGLVNIINGIGTIQIANTVVETVALTLQDSQSTGLDVSSTQDVQFAVGATADLYFGIQPSNVQTNTAIFPAMTVEITDQYGNPRFDTGTWITLATAANPEGAAATGTTSVQTSSGVSMFSNVKIDKAGTFNLVASSGGLTNATSTSFTVTDPPTPPPNDGDDDDNGCLPGTGSGLSLLWILPLAMLRKYRREK
jgi:hypothetical protein